MPDRVAKVEKVAKATLALVCGDDMCLDANRSEDNAFEDLLDPLNTLVA